MNVKAKLWLIAAALVCFGAGLVLSHRIQPGVQVETITLAQDTPALKFIPAEPGPHPVALLAHGYSGSKENLFCYGEALAAAGFVCYSVDQPGHGASTRLFSFIQTAHILEEVGHEIGRVDVFVGHSMGGFTGGEAVREGGMRPKLFVAIGSAPRLGEHAPSLLLLAGRFDEFFSPAQLKARIDARLVLSPWSEHGLELVDPVLVKATVEAACAAIGKTPPPVSTCWLWRITGVILTMLGALGLALAIPRFPVRWIWARGLLVTVPFTAAFLLTAGSWVDANTWFETKLHLRKILLQGATIVVVLLAIVAARKLRIPRWGFLALAVAIAIICLIMIGNTLAFRVFRFELLFAPDLFAGTVVGAIAACRGARLEGDIAMAFIVGCALLQIGHLPRLALESTQSHAVITLPPKAYDAYVGDYEFPPDNVFSTGLRLTILRQGDQLVGRAVFKKGGGTAFKIYPESETNFFLEINGSQQLTFIKNDKGEVTGVIHRMAGLPDSEGQRLKQE